MKKEDEEFLARVAKEEAEHGLVLGPNPEDANFHKVVKRLIDLPPAPKRRRGKRRHNKPITQSSQ